jgi:hypothetical protein
MSKEIELLKECRLMLDNPFNGSAGLNLRNRIDDYFDQPEVPEDIYNEGFKAGSYKANMVELRDHFAGLAMQGILTTMRGDVKADIIAKMSYVLAGAMLAEREKRDV